MGYGASAGSHASGASGYVGGRSAVEASHAAAHRRAAGHSRAATREYAPGADARPERCRDCRRRTAVTDVGHPRAPDTETQSPATNTAPPGAAVPHGPAGATHADPSSAVERFYGFVAQRDYGSAAELWSPRMRATFPPGENINERFSQTQSLVVQRADLISEDPHTGSAAVAVDVVEVRQDGAKQWVGTWYLVRGANGWLLDQPQLTARPT